MVFELFRWWYSTGWAQAAGSISTWSNNVSRTFSVPLLIKTLFSPWKRITGFGGKSLDAKIRASIDNLISRVVGFVTRLLVLVAAGLMMLIVLVAGALFTIIWPLIPIAVIYCITRGILG